MFKILGQETTTSPCDEPTPTAPVVHPVGNMTSLPGVIYIRWGNDVCPEDAELIYSGWYSWAISRGGKILNMVMTPHRKGFLKTKHRQFQ